MKGQSPLTLYIKRKGKGFPDWEEFGHGRCAISGMSFSLEFHVGFLPAVPSYAKNKATEISDVDLLVSMPINGMVFFGLAEVLRERLKKKVDLLDVSQLEGNLALTKEILKDGVRIYG